MALCLILRNSSRLQGANITATLLKRPPQALLWTKPALRPKNSLKPINLTQSRNSATGDHSKLWPIERAVSVGLAVLLPAAVMAPNALFDNLLAVATVAHFHWGLEAVVVDYVRPILFGPAIPKLALGLLYVISGLTLGGLIYYNISDIGIGRTVRKIWSVQSK